MRLKKPAHATVIAYVALFFAMGGTAVAATGGTFILGRSNAASSTTVLTNSAGAALTLNSKTGTAPFTTNSTTKVGRLNADLVDGLDSLAFQRRVGTACAVGSAVRAISATGAVTCERARVQEALGSIDTTGEYTGQGLALCPAGHAVVGGGFDTNSPDPNAPAPPPSLVRSAEAISFAGTPRSSFFFVELTNLDGSPYTGGGLVVAQCVPGVNIDEPSALLRTSGSTTSNSRLEHYKAYLVAHGG